MTIPTQMQAVVITRPGGPESLEQQSWPVPDCGAGEVLIRVAAAGVNGPDLFQRRGHYDPPPGASPLPGLEVAGEIAAIGEGVSRWAPGDGVMALTNGGGYADYVAVPVGQVLPLPDGWSAIEASALPETWFTVTQALLMRAGLDAGMSVLVHGAAGGIGSAAVQIARLKGARAIAVVSNQAKADYATRLGAFATINHTTEDVAARARALTDGRGVDRVIDIIGGPMTQTNIAASARGGHILVLATLSGSMATVALGTLMASQLTLSGSTLRPQTPATKAAIAHRIETDLLPHLSEPGFIRPSVSVMSMHDAAKAHARMETREHSGKIVLLTPFGAQLQSTDFSP